MSEKIFQHEFAYLRKSFFFLCSHNNPQLCGCTMNGLAAGNRIAITEFIHLWANQYTTVRPKDVLTFLFWLWQEVAETEWLHGCPSILFEISERICKTKIARANTKHPKSAHTIWFDLDESCEITARALGPVMMRLQVRQ